MRSCQRCLRVGGPDRRKGLVYSLNTRLHCVHDNAPATTFCPRPTCFSPPASGIIDQLFATSRPPTSPLLLRFSLRFFLRRTNELSLESHFLHREIQSACFTTKCFLRGKRRNFRDGRRFHYRTFTGGGISQPRRCLLPRSSTLQTLPFEITEQLNLTLARPCLTFKASART